MKFNKIFDVTDSDSQATSTHDVYHNSEMMTDEEEQDLIQHDVEVLLPESKEMMGDWTCSEIKVDEINSDALDDDDMRLDLSPAGSSSSIESMDSFYKPEADQSEHEQMLSDLRRDLQGTETFNRIE